MTSQGRLGVALALAVVYAVCYSAIKAGLAYAPPIRYGALRALIAASALLVLLPLTGRPFLPPRRLWVGVTVLAATGTLLAYAAMFSAPGRTGAGLASVLGNTAPLLTLVLAVPLLGERLNTSKTSALLLGLEPRWPFQSRTLTANTSANTALMWPASRYRAYATSPIPAMRLRLLRMLDRNFAPRSCS